MKKKNETEITENKSVPQDNDKKELGRKARQVIFSVNAAIFTIVVLVVFVLVNLIVEQVPMNMDLTEEKLFTLTETSDNIVNGLKEKVEIYALYDRVSNESDSNRGDVIKVLDLYDNYDNVEVSYVDIGRKPVFVRDTVGENNASDYSEGDYIVKCGNRTRRIAADDMYALTEVQQNYFYTQKYKTGIQVETKVTGAIVRVTSDVPKIYWSVGFGEADYTDVNYSTFVENLDDANYEVKTINLKSEEIPEDADVIFFVRPTKDLDDKTVDKLNYWFNFGGNAFFFMDPKDGDGKYITEEFTNFNKVLERYGLAIEHDFVIEGSEKSYKDSSGNTENEDSIFLTSTIQAGSLENTAAHELWCYNTRSVRLLATLDVSLYESAAFMETSIEATSISLLDGKQSSPGKRVLAASAQSYKTHTEDGSKVVVFGSSENLQYAQVEYFGSEGIKAVKNSLAWLDIDTIENPADSIDAKTYNSGVSTFVNTEGNESMVIAIIVAIVIPVVVFAIGFIVWLRRRHL